MQVYRNECSVCGKPLHTATTAILSQTTMVNGMGYTDTWRLCGDCLKASKKLWGKMAKIYGNTEAGFIE